MEWRCLLNGIGIKDIMNSNYDVIVIGAGNAGLVAAGIAAKNGLKTLLLEKNNLPGGSATSFVRGRFEFEVSLQDLDGIGIPEDRRFVYKILKELGVNIDWCYEKDLFRVIVTGKDGYDVTVRTGIDGFCESINEVVPGCEEKVKSLLKLALQNKKALNYLFEKDWMPKKLVMKFKYGDFMRTISHSAEEIEKILGIPEKARNIINAYWSNYGVPTDELNCEQYLAMLRSYLICKPVVPQRRSFEISEALLKAYKDNGGEVWFNSMVNKIITNDIGRVIGVEIKGQKLYAREIISNVIPDNIFHMMNKNHIPKVALKLANAREIGSSAFMIYLGLDCSREELGINDYKTFVMSNPNPRVQYNTNGYYIVNCLNVINPNCSPEGTCILGFYILCFEEKIPKYVTMENYKKYKNSIADKFITEYEKIIGKDIKSHIEEISIATPATFARYLGTPDGTIYGYKLSDWDNMITRSISEKDEYNICGLSFVGGHYIRGHGYAPTYCTGYSIGKRVVAKLKANKK